MTPKISMTKIFLVNSRSRINHSRGWFGDYEKLSSDRSNTDFIEIVEKSNKDKDKETYIIKEWIGPNHDDYDFKNNCFYTWDIKVVEIPTEYYQKKWYEIKNKWNGIENQIYSERGIKYFDVYYDEELILFHEKWRLSAMDSSQKQKIILMYDTDAYFARYSINDIYEQYLFEKAQDRILLPKMTDIELRTNLEFIKWIENIQFSDTETNLENKIINFYRLFGLEEKLYTNFQNNITFMQWIKDNRQLDNVLYFHIDNGFIKWLENNQLLATFSKYEKILIFKKTFEIGEIDINIFNSTCFSIETSSNHRENVIIQEDKYILYKYMNTGKNILQDTSTNPEEKIELLTEFMTNIVENPSKMFDLFNERADFFPRYGCQYIDALKRWKQSVEEQST